MSTMKRERPLACPTWTLRSFTAVRGRAMRRDLLDAHDGAVQDVPSFLLFTRDAHDNHGAVASRFRAHADVGRSPVIITDREQDLGVSRLERAGTAHVPGCAVRNRGARFGPAGLIWMVHMLLVQSELPKGHF